MLSHTDGLVAAGISHPFDTVKTRLQSGAAGSAGKGLAGLAGLYKGFGPAAAASMLSATAHGE